jgi:DNA-directed RNA polymerase subunit N (RpoN/RPB10)
MEISAELNLPPESELTSVRCYTCNKILGNKYGEYEKLLQEGYSIEQALNKLGMVRYCCRLRLRNPFKLVMNKMEEPEELSRFDELSVSSDLNANTSGALSAINSSSVMIEPEESEIQLKPVAALPSKKKKEEPSRTFKAW